MRGGETREQVREMFGSRSKKKLERAYDAMEAAGSYADWQEAAAEVDRLEGNDGWREDPSSPLYDHVLLQEHLRKLRVFRARRDFVALRELIEEGLHRNLGDLSNPLLYAYSHLGTKHLIEAYLDELEATFFWLRDEPLEGFDDVRKLKMVREASRVFGRSALVLSGGGALGLFHLGVVKALWERDLLPEIISGASMGAIVAGGVCTRDDQELAQMWENVDAIHRVATRLQSPRRWRETKSLLAPEQLEEHVSANLANLTFQEAREHSGRILNVPVSPVRRRQKPRLLNHITSPDVLIQGAAVASCSLPALFPPGELYRRGEDGELRPYIDGEVWVDGSIYGDVPTMRLSRLLNVNHYIVSQANPHVLPFLKLEQRGGMLSATADAVAGAARAQVRHALGMARRRMGDSRWHTPLEFAHAMANQNYTGHIDIHPELKLRDYTRVMKNPSLSELEAYINGGERATWPYLAMIRDQTRVSRALARCIRDIEARLAKK